MWFSKKEENLDFIFESKILNKNKIKRYIYLIIGCFLLAFSFNVFFAPNNIVSGGVSGLAIVIKNIFGISTSTFILISYIVLLVLSYFLLGKEKTKYTIIGSILYPIFVYITQDFGAYINFDVDNILLVAVFGAVLNGIGSGLTFKYGFSSGGSDIICMIISKYFKVSIGNAMRIINTIIIIGSGFFISKSGEIYAWENVMYAIIVVYIVSILNDRLLLGLSQSKSFYIITDNETMIKKFLMQKLGMGVTVLEGRGGYTGDRKKVLMCVVPTKSYFLAKEGILALDKNAIILINDVYQSEGIE